MTFLIDPFILFFRSHFYLKASLFALTTTFLPLWMYRPRLVGGGDANFSVRILQLFVILQRQKFATRLQRNCNTFAAQ